MSNFTSPTALILSTSADEFEAHDRLVAERNAAHEFGFEVPEVDDAIDAIDRYWADQQAAEIEAEMAIERYYENIGYDTDGINY